MPIIHITKTAVEKLAHPSSGRVDYFDDALKGFGVRVSLSSKTYFTMRRVNGKLVRCKIDTTDKITAEQARKRAEGTLADMGRGIDPNEEKRIARQRLEEDKLKAITLQEALNQYLQNKKLKPRTVQTHQDLFRLYLSDWLKKPASEITREMVRARHLKIASGERQRQRLRREATDDGSLALTATDQRREAAADNCMRSLRAVLNYAFEDEEATDQYLNPVNVLSSRKNKAWFKVGRRQSIIKNSQLPAWHKVVMALENSLMRDFLLFLLFTGLRRGEAARLKWRHIDFDEGFFTIPETKNGTVHTLPFSSFLLALLLGRKEELKTNLAEAKAAIKDTSLTLKQRQKLLNHVAVAESRLVSEYVFPGEGSTGFIVEPKRAIDTVAKATGIVFSCHDLRRTFATIAESLDLSPYTVKALLNHKQQLNDVTGGYIILDIDRKREPMQRITDAILARVNKQYGQMIQLPNIASQVV